MNIFSNSSVNSFEPNYQNSSLIKSKNNLLSFSFEYNTHSEYNNYSKNFFTSIFDFFKHHLNNIINVIKDIKININNLFKNQSNCIKKELFSIAIKLNDFKYFKREFLDFLRIQEMINYIIDTKKLNEIEYLNFSEVLLKKFLSLLNKKSDYIDNPQEYGNCYDHFIKELKLNMEYFYSEIYVSSHKYDELIDDVTNILG